MPKHVEMEFLGLCICTQFTCCWWNKDVISDKLKVWTTSSNFGHSVDNRRLFGFVPGRSKKFSFPPKCPDPPRGPTDSYIAHRGVLSRGYSGQYKQPNTWFISMAYTWNTLLILCFTQCLHNVFSFFIGEPFKYGTLWSRVLPEKLKTFPAFYEIRRFITAFTTARHLSLSWASHVTCHLFSNVQQ